MKVTAIFLLFLASYATGRPNETPVDQNVQTGTGYGAMFNNAYNSAWNNAASLIGSAKSALDQAGITDMVTGAASTVNQYLQLALEKGNTMTINGVASLIMTSMGSAVSNNLIPQDVADSILFTLRVPGAPEAQELILPEVKNLKIGGNMLAAENYKKGLKEIYEAQIQNEASLLTILACVEFDLLEILGDNGILQSNAAKLFNYYYSAIVEAFRNPQPVIKSVNEFINNLKPNMTNLAEQYISDEYIATFQIATNAIQNSLASTKTLTVSTLQSGLQKLLNQAVSKNIIKSVQADRLAASFGIQTGVTPYKSEELESLEIGGDKDTAFSLRLTLQSAIEKVEREGVSIVVVLSANGAVLSALAGNGALPGSALVAGAKGYVTTAF